ncbi:MAG: SEL1-like repeat protein [Bacteroidales bacterium]|nr:SEL1-like repeat protein [Bacteroidales bacterium]
MNEPIFISYKRIDKDIVLPIVEAIKERTGANCWIDLEGIESGDQFERVIIRAIKNCEILVFMMTSNSIAPMLDPKTGQPDYNTPSWTEREVKFALDRKKRIIPLSIDGTMVTDCDWLAFNCSGIDCINYNDSDQREKFFRNLSKWLKKKEIPEMKHAPKVEEKPAPKVEEKPTPVSPPAESTKPKLKPVHFAIIAAIMGAIAAIAFWPKSEPPKPSAPPVVVSTETVSDKAAATPPAESQNTAPAANEVTTNNQPQPSSTTKPSATQTAASSKTTSTSQPSQGKTAEEAIPTVSGDPTELDNLGVKYLFGDGVKKDPKQAVIYFQSAAKQGLASAQSHLGSCYYTGTGIGQNYKQAFEWFKKAAGKGDITAQDNLGSCYLLGHGTAQNYAAAVEWYQKAADKGNASAQAHLGSCYLYGQGVTSDKDKAIFWYEKAADKGNTTAKRNLEKLKAAVD